MEIGVVTQDADFQNNPNEIPNAGPWTEEETVPAEAFYWGRAGGKNPQSKGKQTGGKNFDGKTDIFNFVTCLTKGNCKNEHLR